MLWNIAVIGGETIKKPYPIEKAFDVRDALVKSIYGRVFGFSPADEIEPIVITNLD